MSDAKMSAQELARARSVLDEFLQQAQAKGYDDGFLEFDGRTALRFLDHIAALEAERDAAREALRICIEAHETGRFEPAQAAINHARVLLAAAQGCRDE